MPGIARRVVEARCECKAFGRGREKGGRSTSQFMPKPLVSRPKIRSGGQPVPAFRLKPA